MRRGYPYLIFLNPAEHFSFGGFCVSGCPYASPETSVVVCPDPAPGYKLLRGRPLIEKMTGSSRTQISCAYRRLSVWKNSDAVAPATPVHGVELPLLKTAPETGYLESDPKWKSSHYVLSSHTANPFVSGIGNSKPVVGRCIPKIFGDGNQTTFNAFGASQISDAASVWQEMWADVARSWRVFLIGGAGAFVFGFVWVFLMRFLACIMVWGTLLLIFCVMAYLSYIALQNAKNVRDSKPSDANSVSTKAQEGLAYALIAITALYLCLLIYLRKRINLAIALLKEASRAIGKMKTMIFLPIIFFVLLLIFLAFWIVEACFLMANAKPEAQYGSWTASGLIRPTQVDFSWDKTLWYLMIYHFFGLLWTSGFIMAFLFMSLAIAVSTWYFMEEKNAALKSPVWKGVKTTFGNHMGTIAFGSFIIGVVQLIRAALLYISHQVKKMNPQGKLGALVKCLLCYCNYCMAYVKRFLEFLSNNAYVETAIEGTSFCRAAKDVFKLIVNNVLRVSTVNFIADFITFCGKVMIAGGCCILAFYLTRVDKLIEGGDASQLNSSLLPVIVVGIIGWFVAQLFMHVYETAMTVILICFLHDEQEYGGKFASADLKGFVATKAPKEMVEKK